MRMDIENIRKYTMCGIIRLNGTLKGKLTSVGNRTVVIGIARSRFEWFGFSRAFI